MGLNMNCFVKVNDIINEILSENKKLYKLVKILIEFKEFCDLIAEHLSLSSDLKNTYLDIIDKYNQCAANEVECRLNTEAIDNYNTSLAIKDDQILERSDRQQESEKCETMAITLNNNGHNIESGLECRPSTSGYQSRVTGRQPELNNHKQNNQNLDELNEGIGYMEQTVESDIGTDVEELEVDDQQESDQSTDERNQRDDKRFKCDFKGCLYRSRLLCHMNRHKIIHSNDRPFRCTVDGCGKRFRRKDNLTAHLQRFTAEANDGQQTKQLSSAKRKRVTKRFVCHFKDCRFRTKSLLCLNRHKISHLRDNQRDGQPYKCDREGCRYKCQTLFYLNRHKISHSEVNDEPFHCTVDGCEERYKTKPFLTHHLQLMHPEEYQKIILNQTCFYCDRKFMSPNQLINHNYKCISIPFHKKSKTNPFLAFAKQMRPVVLSEMCKQMAKQGFQPTMGQVNAELGYQWQRLSDEHKNKFIDMCKD